MTSRNQITIPKKIADAMNLKMGSIFDVRINRNKIEIIPLEFKEREFTDEEWKKIESLSVKEIGKEKKVTKEFIDNLKIGKS